MVMGYRLWVIDVDSFKGERSKELKYSFFIQLSAFRIQNQSNANGFSIKNACTLRMSL